MSSINPSGRIGCEQRSRGVECACSGAERRCLLSSTSEMALMAATATTAKNTEGVQATHSVTGVTARAIPRPVSTPDSHRWARRSRSVGIGMRISFGAHPETRSSAHSALAAGVCTRTGRPKDVPQRFRSTFRIWAQPGSRAVSVSRAVGPTIGSASNAGLAVGCIKAGSQRPSGDRVRQGHTAPRAQRCASPAPNQRPKGAVSASVWMRGLGGATMPGYYGPKQSWSCCPTMRSPWHSKDIATCARISEPAPSEPAEPAGALSRLASTAIR